MNSTPLQAALGVRNLTVTKRIARQNIPIVNDLSLELMPGEIVGLVGESGCGKSMTAAALMGMLPSSAFSMQASELKLGDRDLLAMDEKHWQQIRGGSISMVFQEPMTALDPVISIGQQMSSVIRRHQRCTRIEAREKALDILNQVGLADGNRVLGSYAHELSGGMRQRVLIGMALSCKPGVLIADEPTTALDVTTQKQILLRIQSLARSTRTAVLLITHDLGVVSQVCDRALVMYCGRIVEQAPVGTLFSSPRHPYTSGLIAALPKLSKGPVSRVESIQGSVPGLANTPSGCPFHDRCARADERCSENLPQVQYALDPGEGPESTLSEHLFRCHHPMEIES